MENQSEWDDLESSVEEELFDNSPGLMKNLASLYLNRHLSDLILVVGGVEYPTHRFMLCAASEVFQAMFMNPLWSESKNYRVVLQEPSACSKLFGKFLKYFYTGRITITAKSSTPLLTLADKYNIKDLAEICRKYMLSRLPYAASTNLLIPWLQYTLNYNHHDVAKRVVGFIKWNIDLVCQSPDFGNVEPELMEKFLQQDDIVVHDEMTLFNYVITWLDKQRELLMREMSNGSQEYSTNEAVEAQLKEIINFVMVHIRFPMMSPHQLAALLISPTVKDNKEFFIERMAIGMSFHSGQMDRLEQLCMSDERSAKLFLPRLYTAENLSLLLPLEHFRDLPPYYMQTHVFSSYTSLADYKGDTTCEWVVDVYPKGVWFKKFYRIDWSGKEEMPETVLRTVRLSITCKEPPRGLSLRVKVGVLVRGMADGVEHVAVVKEMIHHFDTKNEVLNLDDIVPFDVLNRTHVSSSRDSPYLVGPDRDVFKVHIIIAPLDRIWTRPCYNR